MVLTSKQRYQAAILSITLGLTLAWGFLPTVKTLQVWMELAFPGLWDRSHLLLFPLLAAGFCYSLPRPEFPAPAPWRRVVALSLLPLTVAWMYGWVTGIPSFQEAFHSPRRDLLLWAVIGAPIGEELLFRGWVYRITARLWKERWPYATSPLPAPLVVSAVAFSLWHVQNLAVASPVAVAFQVGSTFFAGLWLGQLYRMTANILVPILGHIGINAACYGFWAYSTDLLK